MICLVPLALHTDMKPSMHSQYDTLPLRVATVEELEPGDLIFYSGTPFNPQSKRYKFEMTHVEVLIGGTTGKATIG